MILTYDKSRCTGLFSGVNAACHMRDQCARFVAYRDEKHAMPRTVSVMPAVRNCELFIKLEVAK
jgi:hypothetical protein